MMLTGQNLSEVIDPIGDNPVGNPFVSRPYGSPTNTSGMTGFKDCNCLGTFYEIIKQALAVERVISERNYTSSDAPSAKREEHHLKK